MADFTEKRKFVRLNMLADVEYAKKNSPEKRGISLQKNIGAGGICLIVYEELQVAELLDLKIYLPEAGSPITATGKVAWLKEFVVGEPPRGKRYDAGIEFVAIRGG
jgi:hypothetical protein